MRACFLGQNICGLGLGIATLRAPPLLMDRPVPESHPELETAKEPVTVGQHVSPVSSGVFDDTVIVANTQRRMC